MSRRSGVGAAAALAPADVAAAKALAEAIKDVARSGAAQVPPAVLRQAGGSPLGRYVASRLLWDPLADSAGLIREFGE